ncbi:hypothetical protein TTHERM_00148780 (macronuclear) [Tetrahymena thermophila SB210]|uniref:Uncharacterized protein n=1 Tax=Tetrahymena thermophila (strain SB210) TaxID=312017 RepID=I7M2T5_TETTS|nr:hypothetical protein TTHERM_00148780 [Tetrahymena thermophila SB210]EAS01268.1 hypothetical protein TTHERM_00148780 [Tetrahymena thermophila SB210]|eukprot:XP_001021513.1 hypothetical protein TTHERM_00148780 [Tetrahymena thermophila SB210]
MTETATFTSFLKNYNEVNQGIRLQNGRAKIQKSSSQPQISEVRYSTPIMKVFKIKQVNYEQSNQYYSDSYQAGSPLQKQVSQFKGSPQLYKKTLIRKSSQDQSPISSTEKQSTPVHKKYLIIQNNQSTSKLINNQSPYQQTYCKDNSPINAYYVNPVPINNRAPFTRSINAKSQTQIVGETQKSLYFNTPKSNRQNDSLQRVQFNCISQHINKLNESTPMQHKSKFNSQQNLEIINNQQQKQRHFRIHQTNTPIKVQYKIKRNVSTDNRLDSSKRGESYCLHQSQFSTISQENIEKIQSNNQAISELIKGNKQILKDLNFD